MSRRQSAAKRRSRPTSSPTVLRPSSSPSSSATLSPSRFASSCLSLRRPSSTTSTSPTPSRPGARRPRSRKHGRPCSVARRRSAVRCVSLSLSLSLSLLINDRDGATELMLRSLRADPPPRHRLVRLGADDRRPERAPRHVPAPRLDHHGYDCGRHRDEPDRRRRRPPHLHLVVRPPRRHHLLPHRLPPAVSPHTCALFLFLFLSLQNSRSTLTLLARRCNSRRLHHLPPRVGVAARRRRARPPAGRRPAQAVAHCQAAVRAPHRLVGLVVGRHHCRRPSRGVAPAPLPLLRPVVHDIFVSTLIFPRFVVHLSSSLASSRSSPRKVRVLFLLLLVLLSLAQFTRLAVLGTLGSCFETCRAECESSERRTSREEASSGLLHLRRPGERG